MIYLALELLLFILSTLLLVIVIIFVLKKKLNDKLLENGNMTWLTNDDIEKISGCRDEIKK